MIGSRARRASPDSQGQRHAGANGEHIFPIVRWRKRRQRDGRAASPAAPELRLALPAQAESIAAVRAAVREHGELLEIDGSLLADVCLAVTEACTNVVLHAYPDDRPGPLEVTLWSTPGEHAEPTLNVLVTDSGRGLPAAGSAAADALASPPGRRDEGHGHVGLGLGLGLMGALASTFSIGDDGHGQTEVRMTFRLSAHPARASEASDTMRTSKGRQASSRQNEVRRMKVRSGAQ